MRPAVAGMAQRNKAERGLGQDIEAIRAAIATREGAANGEEKETHSLGGRRGEKAEAESKRDWRLAVNSPDLDRLLGAFGGASLVYSNMMLTSWYLQQA